MMGGHGKSSGQRDRTQRKRDDNDGKGSSSAARDIARQEERANRLADRVTAAEREFLDAREEYDLRSAELAEAREEARQPGYKATTGYYDVEAVEREHERAERIFNDMREDYLEAIDRYNDAVDGYNELVGKRRRRHFKSDYV